MKNARLILAVVLLGFLAVRLFGGEIPYQVPEQINNLPDDQYQQVMEMHNEAQYQQAAANVQEGTTYTAEQDTSTTVVSGGDLYWGSCGTYYTTPTRVNTYRGTSRRTFNFNRYGGGPVWIINPFVRTK